MMTGAVHSSPEVQLRFAEAADTEALVRLINEAFAVEKIVVEGELVGCVYVEVKGKRGYLGLLGVRPDRQKSGFGRRLTTAAEDYFRKAGCEAVDLRIVSVRAELPPFYERLGYAATAIAPVPDTIPLKIPSHFIVMSKSL
jgi:GNAT superfamily N-acetyltransferase